jgi:hypothetical protein
MCVTQSFDPSRLAAVLGFTPEELIMNRTGEASDRQRATLQRKRSSGLIGLAFVGVFAIGFGIFATVYLAPKLNDNQHGSSKAPITAIVWGAVGLVALVVLLSALRTLRRLRRMSSGKVREVTGAARTRAHRMPGNMSDSVLPDYGGGIRHELTIGKTLFIVRGQAVLDAFDQGGTYRAYYTTGGGKLFNVLLSAERVG